MNGWFVVAGAAFVVAEWAALLWAFGKGFRAAETEARDWWSGKLDIERETGQRLLADEKRRCAAKVRGARLAAEPFAARLVRIDRARSARSN